MSNSIKIKNKSLKHIVERVEYLAEAITLITTLATLGKIRKHEKDEDTSISKLPKKTRKKLEELARKKFPNDPRAVEKAVLEAKDRWITNQRMNDFKENSIQRKEATENTDNISVFLTRYLKAERKILQKNPHVKISHSYSVGAGILLRDAKSETIIMKDYYKKHFGKKIMKEKIMKGELFAIKPTYKTPSWRCFVNIDKSLKDFK